jgi:Restriction endonuclease
VWLKTQRSWWDRLHPQRFEQEVAAFFKTQGHRVEWTGRSGDGGVDIRLTTSDGKKIIVQCKAHGKPVTRHPWCCSGFVRDTSPREVGRGVADVALGLYPWREQVRCG